MDITNFFLSIGITLSFTVVSSAIYFRIYNKKDVAFSTAFYGILVFSIVYFVSFESNLGLGIGLLGILSLIRLRSTPENLIDISFIFYSITIGLINASVSDDYMSIAILDLVLTVILIVLASGVLFRKNIVSSKVVFDDLEFEKLDSVKYLKERVKKELKIDPIYVAVTRIDYLKDSVNLRVTYELKK
jgi:Domain of unknown function (DUF4956)